MKDENILFNRVKVILGTIIAEVPAEHRPLMPEDPSSAAVWWIRCQAPPHEMEHAENVSSRAQEWPYTHRLKSNLRIFLSTTIEHQALIIKASEQNIYWYGDEYEVFSVVIQETKRFRRFSLAEHESRRAVASRKAEEIIWPSLQ